MRFNATMKAKYQALRAAGKTPKVALTAIMRKLPILANASYAMANLVPKTRLTITDTLTRPAPVLIGCHWAVFVVL